MPADAAAPGTSAWTFMLADIVALMLAFFVLTFSMREMVDAGRRPTSAQPVTLTALVGETVGVEGDATDPGQGVPLALATNEGHTADQLQAPEQAAANAPSLAYLAAIIQGEGREPSPSRVWHDDTVLVVELPEPPDANREPLADAALRPLLSLAFLARRFDLDLAVALPTDNGDTLVDLTARASKLREWLAAATGLPVLEVTFTAIGPSVAPTATASRFWAALQVKAVDKPAIGPPPP